MDEEEELFADAENFRSEKEEKITYNQIVLNQVSRITSLMSVEFHGGTFKETHKKLGDLTILEKTYIPDTRESFKNAINCLYDIAYPKFDKVMQKCSKDFEDDKQKIIQKLNKQLENGDITEEEAKNQIAQYQRIIFRDLMDFFIRTKFFQKKIGRE